MYIEVKAKMTNHIMDIRTTIPQIVIIFMSYGYYTHDIIR
jgi:hypothetical protein